MNSAYRCRPVICPSSPIRIAASTRSPHTLTIRTYRREVAAQLIARHWIITDSDNHVQEVKGLGVVGHQPLLPPGEQFEYTSWAVIATPVGTMRGAYFCVAEDGERFEAPVAEFALHMPRTLH